ncbi:MAG: hypothetical protein P4L50_06185 [Anaerolineaceae bacterium]|nr:hypothetical protein [Anaerolineaceae bacterium]
MGILQSLAGILSFVAGLWMVVILFQKKGILHGILGLICELYTFIWGLIHFSEPEIKTPMTIWLIAIGISIVLTVIGFLTRIGSNSSSFLPMFM